MVGAGPEGRDHREGAEPATTQTRKRASRKRAWREGGARASGSSLTPCIVREAVEGAGPVPATGANRFALDGGTILPPDLIPSPRLF